MLPNFPPRKFISTIAQFSVLQWNQLNSLLCNEPSFPKIAPEFLKWNYRKPLITKELLSYNSDIICLEEVDQVVFYDEFFKNQGYSVLKAQKSGGTGDWIIIAFKDSKFKLLDQKVHFYNQNLDKGKIQHSQFFLHASLQFDQDHVLWVFATHLKAKDFEDMRKVQTGELFDHIKAYDSLTHEEKQKIGIVVCGDFNAEPHYGCMKPLIENLEWAYKEAEYTTMKVRDKMYCRVIDYIFYGKNTLKLVGKQEIPKKEEMDTNGLPNAVFPSDHLSLYTLFQFN